MFISGTTLHLDFIPTVPAETLLKRADSLKVHGITAETFGDASIDAAMLKIFCQGARAAELGLLHLSADEMMDFPLRDAVVTLDVAVGLKNFANEFPDHARENHGIKGAHGTEIHELIIQTIGMGELNDWREVGIDPDHQKPKDRHYEIQRRAIVDRAWAFHLAHTCLEERAPVPIGA